MKTLKIYHAFMPLLAAALITACAHGCREPQPAQAVPLHTETTEQRLLREQQDMADFAALEREKAYERMSDGEKMEGVVYE